MTFRVLLIEPTSMVEGIYGSRINMESSSPPLGLLYIAAVLKKEGFSVKLLDMNAELIRTKKQLVRGLRTSKPDLVGISTLTPTFKSITDVAETCKEEFPGSPIILGGYFATFNHDRILAKYRSIDFVARKEGEGTATELAMELEKRKPELAKIRGLSYRENGKVRINEDRPLIENLDSLPFPAYELVSHLTYGYFGGIRTTSKNLGGLLTSRGCHYTCRFCSCAAFTNSTIRWRSPQSVVEELRFFNDKYGLNEYMFVDDNFTFNKDRVMEICRTIKKEGLDLDWYCEGRVNQADENMFREMFNAGCKVMYFGIESCVDKILKYYRKGITYEMAKQAVNKARRAGLDVVGSFILGAPIETIAEMRETIEKAVALDIDFAQINILRLCRGMPLWTELAQQGLIDDENKWEDSVMGLEIHPQLTLDNYYQLLKDAHKRFYLRKSYMLKQLLRSLHHRRKQIFLNLTHIRRFYNELRSTLYLQKEEPDL
ncbi:MAG: radical SAM protein [Promethearchaeati archaeon SRVP18_Atabeyarchaeia-1]